MIQELARYLEPIKNRVRLMIARALVSAVFDETEGGIRLTLDLGFGEVRDDLELVQQYGMTSRPKPGSQAVTLFVSGSRDAGVVIATKGMGAEMSFRLAPGEVALHTDEGDSVHLKNGRVVSITTETLEIHASERVVIDSPSVEANGEVSDSVGRLSALRTKYTAHTHVGNLGAPTSPTTQPDPGP